MKPNHLERSDIAPVVLAALSHILSMHKPTQQIALDESTMLVGQHAVLDSLGLVLFAVELEQHLEDELELAIVLNDEREMTRRNSAFSSVATLTDFILAQLSNTTAPLSHG